MAEKKIIRCFIASPGDTSEEREICEKVFSEINVGLGVTYNFHLESIRWENDVRPGIGEDGQDVINQQVKDGYDLFIGIMYLRFGSPTKRADSGTEEEFNIAYERAKNLQNLEIMFYFNDAAANPSSIDFEQYQKVTVFRENVVQQKCMYAMYNGATDFENQIRNHLNLYFNQQYASVEKLTLEISSRTSVILEKRLNDALQLFSVQPRIWIDPVISSTKNDLSENPDDNFNNRVDIKNIVSEPSSLIISAPPQFGLTCLSHFLILEAWKVNKLWIYVDAKKFKAHQVTQYINNEITQLGISPDKTIECIVIDGWNPFANGSLKKLKAICDTYPDIPIILMRTIEDAKFLRGKQEDVKINRSFDTYFLLAMTRSQIRTVVKKYNQKTQIADDDALLEKVVSDFTTLNIHRTPQNCLTLLKVDEKKFDTNPVNRSQMLEDVLYVLFEFADLPRYSSLPDVKDCQYLLGCFCEMLILDNRSSFSREEFIKETKKYSRDNLIEIEVNVVFEILYQNNIITEVENTFCFKSAFWFLYFIARRMNNNKDFADYIFETKKYLDYPEIIEFYTGIDRNKTDALNILLKDITNTCNNVFKLINIPDNINPYKHAKWCPDEKRIEQIQQEISDSVMSSGLPEAIKDKFHDKSYNQLTPFNQNVVIHDFFEEYCVYNLMQEIKSSSRALRNSDYADATVKKSLLSEILRGWLQVSKVLLALTPILASKGRAEFHGAGFSLCDGFGETEEERAKRILFVILTNVVAIFKDDIYSSKIAPLLYDKFEHSPSSLVKQQLALLFIICRPSKWYKKIDEYIISLPKDSFFLWEIVNEMRSQYRFGFLEESDSRTLPNLIRKSLAKHEFGVRNPSLGQINQIPTSSLPKREEKDDSIDLNEINEDK